MVFEFIEDTQNNLIELCKAGNDIPRAVFNLAFDREEDRHQVTVNEVPHGEEEIMSEAMIQNSILTVEWDLELVGLENLCSIYAEGLEKDGNACLLLHIKVGEDQRALLYEFIVKGMVADAEGNLRVDYEERVHYFNLNG